MTQREKQHTKKLLKSFSRIGKRGTMMKKNRSFAIGGVLCCFLVLMAGCASSELVDIWSDSSFQPPSLNKMLVISVIKNSVQRRMWEDAFSAELAKHGVAVTPSYRLFPDAVPDTNQITQIVGSNNFDGVLVTRRLPSETNAQYTQGYVTTEQGMRYDRRRERFVTYYRDIDHAGYVDSQKVDIRTIDVWATRNEGQMIWSATSKTPEPNSVQEVRPEIIKLVMSELTKQRIIASER
jgi:hypothetical protein